MGFLAQLAEQRKMISLDSGIGVARSPTDRGASRQAWQQIFGNVSTNKEEAYKQPPVRGGTYGRSVVGGEASYKRLLQSLRSMAPGGWSDDRWEQTARHFVGIAYVAIHRICSQLQQAEFQVFEKDDRHPDGKRPIYKGHPAYRLVELLEKPNQRDSFGKLMYRWGQQKYLTGKALTWMVPNLWPNVHPDEKYRGAGTPFELYCIPTAIAIPQPAINPDYPDGYYRIQPIYPYGPFSSYPTPATAVGAPIPAQWMLDFSFPHPLLWYDGYSPLTGLRMHLDEIESMDRSRWYTMKRQMKPSAILQFDEMEGAAPLPEEEIDRIRAEFENDHQGAENAGKLFVSTPGAQLVPWSDNLKDLEYAQGWDQLTSFALGGFGITRPAAGMVEDSSYSTLFATLKQLNLVTLEPECQDIASSLTRNLAPFFGDNLIIEIRCRRIDDHDIQGARLDRLIAAKAIKKNELRRELEMPMTKEAWGEEFAGDDHEALEQQKQAMELQQQQAGGLEEIPDEARGEPAEVAAERPTPGNLSEGALGPMAKRLLVNRFKALRNGHLRNGNGLLVKHKEANGVGQAKEHGIGQQVININLPADTKALEKPVNVDVHVSPTPVNVRVPVPKVNVNVPAPEVTVKNNVQTPSVTVKNEVKTPSVTVRAPNITNEVKPADVTIENNIEQPPAHRRRVAEKLPDGKWLIDDLA